jgi:ABC-type polysaccharide/polyol phosphate transport system ATPase subunit
MSTDAIIVKNVSKKYAKNYKSALNMLKQDFFNSFKCKEQKELQCNKNEFKVLDNINFKVNSGDKIAILGNNGAGKSTLLKMIFGIILPDKGSIEINGVVGGILELGGGFKKQLSGRENIYLIGSLYNKSKDEIEKIIDEIIDFTELEDFIDSPISFYSSGMKAKLSFALYLYMKPDILILDEVFAAGDKNFRIKAKKKLMELIASSTTILVSHNLKIVQDIAKRVIVLKKGKIIFDGDVKKGIEIYKGLK